MLNNLLEVNCSLYVFSYDIFINKKLCMLLIIHIHFFSGFKSTVDFDRNSSERVFNGAYWHSGCHVLVLLWYTYTISYTCFFYYSIRTHFLFIATYMFLYAHLQIKLVSVFCDITMFLTCLFRFTSADVLNSTSPTTLKCNYNSIFLLQPK